MTSRLVHARRATSALLGTAMLLLLVTRLAFPHAVVYPKSSTAGAYERYVLRVPNEKAAATTRIEIHFPAELRVTAFAEVSGWPLQVLTDSARRITGAVWTGTLPPQRFVELPFVAANPKSPTRLVWPVLQTYADGETVSWTGKEGEKAPASVTVVGAKSDGREGTGTSWVAWASLGVGLVALGLSLRRTATV
jgi:uncharacterized protein YcnI